MTIARRKVTPRRGVGYSIPTSSPNIFTKPHGLEAQRTELRFLDKLCLLKIRAKCPCVQSLLKYISDHGEIAHFPTTL